MPYFKTHLLLPFVLLAPGLTIAGPEVQTIRAGASAEISIFLEARYTQTGTENPVVQEATVYVAKKNTRPELVTCKQSSLFVEQFQSSPYGQNSQGKNIELTCSNGELYLFTLTAGTPAGKANDCGVNKIKGTPPAAMWFLGHQSVCMEQWSKNDDPKALLSALK